MTPLERTPAAKVRGKKTIEPPTHIVSDVAYSNRWLTVREDKLHYPDRTELYPVVERADSVLVVPITPSRRTILLQQYRHPIQGFSWELPMGGIDANETPEAAAARELYEELRLRVSSLELINTYRAVPGLTAQQVFVFIGRLSDQEFDAACIQNNDDGITAFEILPFESALEKANKNLIQDGLTLAGLFFAMLHGVGRGTSCATPGVSSPPEKSTLTLLS